MRVHQVVATGVLVLCGASMAQAESAKAAFKPTAESSAGLSGTATLTDTAGGLQVTVELTHVTPGQHGVHVHQYGQCSDGGNGAGGHFNPDNVTHGLLPKDGLAKAHPGDLGNIEVGPDGSGTLSVVLPGVSLSGSKYAVAGRAIIVHEKPDDFGQPTGNAGGRIACGPILVTKE